MAYVIQGRLIRVDTTNRYSPPFLMAGLNAVLACMNFSGSSGSNLSLDLVFEVSNDGSNFTPAATATGISVTDSTPKSADSASVTTPGFIGGIWCRLNMKITTASSYTEVILDVNTYGR